MFRPSVPLSFLLLMASLAAATRVQAADVATATFNVTIARSSRAPDEIDVEFRVTGTDLSNGTLTQPIPGAAPIALTKRGADLIITDTFRNEAELTTFLPSGSYVLRLNSGAIQTTLAYTRPAVPSPEIAEPRAGEVVAPGSIAVKFSPCPACSLAGDSVKARLEDASGALLDEETLTSSSASWTPQGASGALLLPARSSFATRVTHATLRQASVSATDADGTLVFSHHFVQYDEIGFKTGFDRPVGHVCLAASYPAPPPGCKLLTDPALQVLDTSGIFAAQVAGHALEYTLSVAANGAISGSAAADLDDDGSLETSASGLKGKLAGKSGELRSKLGFALVNAALAAKLKLKRADSFSIPSASFSATQTATGAIGATKIKEASTSSGALPFAPLGWLLEFDVDSTARAQNAVLTLEGGRSFALAGSHKFGLASGKSSLKLQSSGRGIRIALKKLSLDDGTSPLGVSGGSVSPRILGQRARAVLP